MDANRKKLSGHAYRRKALEKKQKEEKLVKQTHKIDSFFNQNNDKASTSNLASSFDENLAEVAENTTEATVVEGDSKDNNNLIPTNLITSDEVATNMTNNSNIAADPADPVTNVIPSPASSSELNTIASQPAPLHGDFVCTSTVTVENDPALWQIITEELIDYFSKNGFKQNIENEDFSKSKRWADDRHRFLSKDVFKTNLINGERVSRSYLIYSKSLGSVFCGPCRIFDSGKSHLASQEGFSDWKHANERIQTHETGLGHKNCVLKLKQRGQVETRINSKLYEQLEDEKKYWRNVLLRVVVAVKSLATRGLSFRGKTDKFGSPNNGNFMMILEAIAEFDPFLAKHIQNLGNPGKGNTSYLSFATYEKIIKLMGAKVQTKIIEDLQRAKYFSFSVDSTPDNTHIDQLSLILRFVDKNGDPIEHFICFLPNTGHKAGDMLLGVTEIFKTLDINVKNCRGQSYDNAKNMSGQYNGLQAKIKEQCEYATYVPCAAHSLNLVGTSAAECCLEATKFFGLLQNLYVFFTASTGRSKILQDFLTEPENVTLKSLSQTRWSARDDACSSLNKDWNQVIAALEAIKSDIDNQTALVRNEAAGLIKQLNSLETAILSEVWGAILKQFNIASKVLQGVDSDLEVVSNMYASLINYVQNKRDCFDEFEDAGKKKSSEDYKHTQKRVVKRKKRDDESREGEVLLQGRDHFRVHTFYPICDQLLGELRRRKTAYDTVTTNFNFLGKLNTMSEAEVRRNAINLKNVYPLDLAVDLQDECVLLKHFLAGGENKSLSLRQLSLFIKDKELKEAFPYIEIALRIFLCTAVTNCSAERSFSVLKRIKNYLRSTISEERLNSLAILHIEAELTNAVNYDSIIDDFVNKFVHRKLI